MSHSIIYPLIILPRRYHPPTLDDATHLEPCFLSVTLSLSIRFRCCTQNRRVSLVNVSFADYCSDMTNRPANTKHGDEGPFFHGFIPIWALTLFVLAIVFAVVFVIATACHLAGCRPPPSSPPPLLDTSPADAITLDVPGLSQPVEEVSL